MDIKAVINTKLCASYLIQLQGLSNNTKMF